MKPEVPALTPEQQAAAVKLRETAFPESPGPWPAKIIWVFFHPRPPRKPRAPKSKRTMGPICHHPHFTAAFLSAVRFVARTARPSTHAR